MNKHLPILYHCLYAVFCLLLWMPTSSLHAQICSIQTTNYIQCTGKLLEAGDGLTATCTGCPDTPTITWWDAPTGGNQLASGTFFQPTFDIYSTGQTVFYAQCACTMCTSERVPAYVVRTDCSPAPGECTYLLVLEDSGNNGWQGGRIEVAVNEQIDLDTYTLPSTMGGIRVIPISIENGGILDLEYIAGADATENSFYLLDPFGNVANDTNGAAFEYAYPIPAGVLPRVKTVCPASCTGETLSTKIVITMGTQAEEQSWELTDSQGNRLAFANGNTYNGLEAGTSVQIALHLDICETYSFRTFDGANDGWSGGTWQILTASVAYGDPVSPPSDFLGYHRLASGPTAAFAVEEFSDFTLPCPPTCPDRIVATNIDATSCTADVTVPVLEAAICYPNGNHGLGCTILERAWVAERGDFSTIILPTTGAVDPTVYSGGVHFDNLPIGLHDLVYEISYCDGQTVRCTTDILVSRATEPTMACGGNVTVALGNPDQTDENMTGSLLDDLDECLMLVDARQILPMSGICAEEAIYEYELVLLDENDQPLVLYNENGHPLDQYGRPILPDSGIEPAHHLVGTAQIGATIKYQLTHLYSGHLCCGSVTVEDNLPPLLECTDYAIPCTHPAPLDPFYSHTTEYQGEGLPANIAGGTAGIVSVTEIPFEVGCSVEGEVLQDIRLELNIEHSDIEDLRILLTPPIALGVGSIELMPFQTCTAFDGNATNMQVVFAADAENAITETCTAGNPILQGVYTPADLTAFETLLQQNTGNAAGTWTVTILDNDDNGMHDLEAGVGQVVAANLHIESGVPSPYANALDCSEIDIALEMQMVQDNNCDLTDWVGSTIMRVWRATDAHGNSATCQQLVQLKAPTFNDIQIPADRTINCEDLISTEPSETGFPEFGCASLLDASEDFCDISITYEDQVSNGCNQRIIRTWMVTNWCTTVMREYKQVIDIQDTTGPSIAVPDVHIGSSSSSCDGNVWVNPTVTDACSDIHSVWASYDADGDEQVVTIDGMTLLENLPFGETAITIYAKDACGNTSMESFTVTVGDDVAPTAVCDDDLNITLNGAGYARLLAIDVNEGSNDNCGIATMEVRRTNGCLGESGWDQFVDFACCDIGTPVTVELRVTDYAGNATTCWMTLDIEDKTAPVVLCPPDKTITCYENYQDLSQFGSATALDNCNATVEMTASGIAVDNCGAGFVTRTFTATDEQGLTDVCTQTITVEAVSGYTVRFPADVTVNDCSNVPQDTGMPIFSNDGCGLIGISHNDVLLTVVPDACYKIKRTWTVMDWCVFDEDNPLVTPEGLPTSEALVFEDDGDGYFEYVQYIKILDNTAPTLTCGGDQFIESTSTTCTETVTASVTATDNCAPADAFVYTYHIDLDNDGGVDVTGNAATLTYTFPYGTHRIFWEVEDGCGNKDACEQTIEIIDNAHPSVTCFNGLAVEIMGTGIGEIWASDFFQYADDNCSEEGYLQATVLMRRANTNDPLTSALTVDCSDLGTINVEIWVEDEAGNGGYCTTYFILQDNENICGGGDSERIAISGNIRTESQVKLQDAMVKIMENNMQYPTGTDGNYGFNDLPMYQNYTIAASKNDDPVNGVTTADLVFISQHILGIRALESPYQLIAADANNDGRISTFDVVQLRQLILYVIPNFPNNTSWRFVDANYVFPIPTDPWAEVFPEYLRFEGLDHDQWYADFVAVKIGDVNGTAIANASETQSRNQAMPRHLSVKESTLSEGETLCVPFYADDFAAVEALQFTMTFDDKHLVFNEIHGKQLDIHQEHLGTPFLEDGILTFAWNHSEAVPLSSKNPLFEVCFEVKKSHPSLQALLDINARYTATEWCSDKECSTVDLVFSPQTALSFELYQNSPNPFRSETNIAFQLPEADVAALTIFDTNGKIVYRTEKYYEKGYHQIPIRLEHTGYANILFYQLKTADYQATRKMVLAR